MKKAWYFVVPLIIFNVMQTTGQTKEIDSLRSRIIKETNPGKKIELIYYLSAEQINPDTLLPYVRMAVSILKKSENKANKKLVEYSWAYYYVRRNMIDSALNKINILIRQFENDPEEKAFYLSTLFFKAKILDRETGIRPHLLIYIR